MILVEFTEREFAAIKKVTQTGQEVSSSNYDTEKLEVHRKENEQLKSILQKLDDANQPKEELLISFKDFLEIKSMAISNFKILPSKVMVSKKEIEQKDLPHILLVNALIMWLNSKNLLKGLASFDYTDDTFNFEGIEE